MRWEKYDKLWAGFVAGLILPAFWYLVLQNLYDGIESMGWLGDGYIPSEFRQRTSALVGICLNILPLQVFKARHMDKAMRGVVFPTVLLVAVWLYFFGSAVIDI